MRLPAPVNHVVEGFAEVGPRVHVSMGDMLVCLSAPGTVKVLSVEPIQPIGQITVVDYGFRSNPFLASPPRDMLGDRKGSLAQSGFSGGRAVDVACGAADSGLGDELGVEFTNPTGTGAAASGWRITYESAGERQTFEFPLVFAACPRVAGDPDCLALQKEADPTQRTS